MYHHSVVIVRVHGKIKIGTIMIIVMKRRLGVVEGVLVLGLKVL